MTQEEFWKTIQEQLEIPFDIEDVVNIEPDLLGSLCVDLENGETYTLSFNDTEIDWDDEE